MSKTIRYITSKTITQRSFNTIDDADVFVDNFIEKLPQHEKHHYHAIYCIENEQIIVKIKRSDFRHATSLVMRTCAKCHQHVEYWHFSRANAHLDRKEIEKKWLDPMEKMLCFSCCKRLSKCKINRNTRR